MRYVYSIKDAPEEKDYFYEATKTTNYHFPMIPAHSHAFFEVYILLSGDIRLKVGETVMDVTRGSVIIIPPHVRHQLLPAGENLDIIYDRIYMYLSTSCLRSFDFHGNSIYEPLKLAADNKQYLFNIKEHDDYNTILDCMLRLYKNKKTSAPGREMLNRSDILRLMSLIGNNINEVLAHKCGAIGQTLFAQIANYLDLHYHENIILDDLAKRFFINKHTLSKHFKKEYNMSIHEYRNNCRIQKAKEQLLNGVPPTEVAMLVGFTDYSTFYRAFVKAEGYSPKDFIKNELLQ